jgi:hypothetical protein
LFAIRGYLAVAECFAGKPRLGTVAEFVAERLLLRDVESAKLLFHSPIKE